MPRGSERSEESCISQDTTHTCLSDEESITGGGTSVGNKEINKPGLSNTDRNLEIIDETVSGRTLDDQTGFYDFPHQSDCSLSNANECKQNPSWNEANVQLSKISHLPCKTQLPRIRPQTSLRDCCRRELAPLLEQDSVTSADSANSLSSSDISVHTNGNETTAHMMQESKTLSQSTNKAASRWANGLCDTYRYVELTKRCDVLVNQLQTLTYQYGGLQTTYRKHKKLFLILAVINLVLIISVVSIVPSLIIAFGAPPPDEPPVKPPSPADYAVCFPCDDLQFDPYFSIATLREVHRKGDGCCFKSITSVYLSLKQVFQNQIDDRVKVLNFSVTSLQNNPLVNGYSEKQNFSSEYIIRRLLLLNAPTERTAVQLTSAEGRPVQDETISGIFNKLRWIRKEKNTVVTGKAGVSRNGLNIQVHSEGYYFIFARLHFKSKPGYQYRGATSSYSVNRQRGSTSTYIHKAKESCQSGDSSMEHNGLSEMVVHLSRYDEIFISVLDADKEFLSTDEDAHVFGLFSI